MRFKQLVVLLATLGSIFGIYFINSGQTSLKQTGEVAGREEAINYTLPPGFIFSIWGLIYLGFLVYAFYGISRQAQENTFMNRTAWPVTISMVLNLVWTVIVGLEWWVAAYPVQWIMLGISIYLLKQWGLNGHPVSSFQKWMSLPFALYAGWLTVAMIPFTSDLLNEAGWDGGPLSRETWGVILYSVAVGIVMWAYTGLKQPFYLLPVAWALFGFFTRFDGLAKTAAALLAGLLLLYFLWQVVRFYSHRNRVPAYR